MPKTKPTLYIFAISHYCEKARWALDFHRIDYVLKFVAPGDHAKIARQLGAPRSSVPYLVANGQVIQGSQEIIAWADTESGDKPLTPGGNRDAWLEIEQRIDDIAGVHIRRYYYSEAIVEHPQTVRPVFTKDLPFIKKVLISLAWGKIRGVMIKRMDLGAEQGLESKAIVERELDWIDSLLADGREYLVDGRFSRVDMAVASLLSPLAMPAQHPTYASLRHPPRLAADVAGWNERPSLQWVRDIYAKHR